MAPLESLITPLGWEMINDLPPVYRRDPTIRAILHAQAKEAERRREWIEKTRAELFPQTATDVGLAIFEAMLRLTVRPVGSTLADRRSLVMAAIQSVGRSGTGSAWEAALLRIAGPGATYTEYDADDPAAPPAVHTVVIRLPLPAGSASFEVIRTLLRSITPLDVTLIVSSIDGFTLDQSQLDQEAFGA